MGKSKTSTPAERKLIWDWYQKYKCVKDVMDILTFSRGKVNNAIKHYKIHQTFQDLPRIRPRKTTKREDKYIGRVSKAQPFATSTEIRADLEKNFNVKISAPTVRRRLKEVQLNGRVARRKPNVSKKNIKARLKFAKDHLAKTKNFWDLVVWSDESKFNVFGNDGRPYVRRPPLKELDPRYTKKTVKHGGSSVMVWGCFTASGVGPIVQIDGKMNGIMYRQILEDNLVGDFEDDLPVSWIFQQDNDPKHKSRVVTDWINGQNIRNLDWPAQSPDLNPIENLWGIIKRKVAARKPANKKDLWHLIQEEWYKITAADCGKLVRSMPHRCAEVLRGKGFPTKY